MSSANEKSFFLPGECQDPGYRNVRDGRDESLSKARKFVELLYSRYRDLNLMDRHFREDARNHFQQRFWEMYLAVALTGRGLRLQRSGNEGPEFYFLDNGRKVWVEAVAPGQGEGEDKVPEISYGGEVCKVPIEKIILRFTSALYDKRKKYNESLKNNIITGEDHYILAINSRNIPHAPYGNTLPYFVQAFLPFGNLSALVDTKTGKIVETFYQLRDKVEKISGATVPTTAFLDHNYSFVSAALHSAVDCANHPAGQGDDFRILYNPPASNPLDHDIFEWYEQWFYRDGKLGKRPSTPL